MDSQANFADKKKLLFESLTSAEVCIRGTSLDQTERAALSSTRKSPSKTVSRKFQGKESIFKRPEAPIQRCLRPRRMPDYQVESSFFQLWIRRPSLIWFVSILIIFCYFEQANPHKWKKYSLGDTDISDNTNTSAAFAFLKEIEKRKDNDQEKYGDDEVMDMSENNKIVFNRRDANSRQPTFKKSVGLRKQIERDDDDTDPVDQKVTFRGSKMVMPEYVIGQKAKKTKKLPSASSTSTDARQTKANKPQLQHLFDNEEDDE